MKRHEAMINRAKMAQRNLGMWDTMVNEVESVGLGVAEAVKDEVAAIEEDIAKIEEVAGKPTTRDREWQKKKEILSLVIGRCKITAQETRARVEHCAIIGLGDVHYHHHRHHHHHQHTHIHA